MEFVTQQDVEAPQDFVFGAVSDFTAFERQALRRGIEITRKSEELPVGVGTDWLLKVNFRNRLWGVRAKIIAFDPPSGYRIRGVSDGVDIDLIVDLMALSRNTTRLTMTIEFIPRSLTTRLLIQSLRLVRGRIDEKLVHGLASFARDTEEKFRAIS